jgi:hypothetical protein
VVASALSPIGDPHIELKQVVVVFFFCRPDGTEEVDKNNDCATS